MLKRALVSAGIVGALIASTVFAGYIGARVERAASARAIETSVAAAKAAEQHALTAQSEAEAIEAQLSSSQRELAISKRKLRSMTSELKAERERASTLAAENEVLNAVNGPSLYQNAPDPDYGFGYEDPSSPSYGYDSDPSSEYPSYDGYDVDCADVTGPVVVPSDDPHGLDGDGDGIGCES